MWFNCINCIILSVITYQLNPKWLLNYYYYSSYFLEPNYDDMWLFCIFISHFDSWTLLHLILIFHGNGFHDILKPYVYIIIFISINSFC